MTRTLIFLSVILIIFGWLILSYGPFHLGQKSALDINQFRILSLSEQIKYLDQAGKEMSILEIRDFIKLAYPDEPNGEHGLSHKLGALAVEKEGIAGFGFCDSLLQFGCFHGAALAAVRIRGDDPNLSRELWEGCKSKAKIPGSCLHGLGHAITMIRQYDLLAAYEECENLLNDQDSFWCEDGVSMENIARSMAPAGLGVYGKNDDIYYPCNSIPKRFEASCVRNHVGYLYRLWGADFSRAINFCVSFGVGRTAEECINVIGSIIASDYIDNQEKLISKCRLVEQYNQFCIEGAVVNYSMSRQFDRAEKLCNTLEETGKKSCFGKIESFRAFP